MNSNWNYDKLYNYLTNYQKYRDIPGKGLGITLKQHTAIRVTSFRKPGKHTLVQNMLNRNQMNCSSERITIQWLLYFSFCYNYELWTIVACPLCTIKLRENKRSSEYCKRIVFVNLLYKVVRHLSAACTSLFAIDVLEDTTKLPFSCQSQTW